MEEENGQEHRLTDEEKEMLDRLKREAFEYFMHEVNDENGLIRDKTDPTWPASICATGFGLSLYPVGVERGLITREVAIRQTLATLRFLWQSEQSDARDATGYKGFYYHFLDMESGRRVWRCELSTVDTCFLIAGALSARQYFSGDSAEEQDIRELADKLYLRVDWQWALDGSALLTHGWKPESGFLPYPWKGYDESILLYILALGSPTYPLEKESYDKFVESYSWKKIYGYEFAYAGPLFIHQYSHMWIDFRGIQDDFMRSKGIDYFENSRRATYVQQEYAIRNPRQFKGYGDCCWGITASDGPGPATMIIDGIERHFHDYLARGVPYGPDDGTIAPWAVVACLPFAPEIVMPTIEHFNELELEEPQEYGYHATINQTHPDRSRSPYAWISPYYYGINQGPIAMMIENYRSGLNWRLMRQCEYLVAGLRKAGFSGGWLDESEPGFGD
jgi:hypothetical protein